MVDDRKRRDHERFARAPSAVPEPFDEDKTPLPASMEEAFGWQHVDRRLVALETSVRGYTADVSRHEQSIAQWSGAVQECLVDIAGASQRLAGIETALNRDWEQFSKTLGEVSRALTDFGQRMTRLEAAVEGIGRTQIEQAARLIAVEKDVADLKLDKRDKQVATTAEKALRRRWWSYVVNARNATIAVASTVTLVIARWGDVVDFFSSLGR